jgi:hypothetical protein
MTKMIRLHVFRKVPSLVMSEYSCVLTHRVVRCTSDSRRSFRGSDASTDTWRPKPVFISPKRNQCINVVSRNQTTKWRSRQWWLAISIGSNVLREFVVSVTSQVQCILSLCSAIAWNRYKHLLHLYEGSSTSTAREVERFTIIDYLFDVRKMQNNDAWLSVAGAEACAGDGRGGTADRPVNYNYTIT